MITVQEFIDKLNRFPKDMQIVISTNDSRGADPFPAYFQLTESNDLNESFGKDVVLIDYFVPFNKE